MIKSDLFIQRALISVSDKSNILEFSKLLTLKNIQLLSTDGTAKLLNDSGISTSKVSSYTKFPEIMKGRLKTLHHKIYAGILNQKGIDDSIMNQHKINKIDMVVINFYPLHTVVQSKKFSPEEILEYIDIGGPNIIRASIKNYENVVTVIQNNDYGKIIDEINNTNGFISLNTRFHLAKKALQYLVEYDQTISNYFQNKLTKKLKLSLTQKTDLNKKSYISFPEAINIMHLTFKKKQKMIYGENPHQKSILYTETNTKNTGSVATAKQIQGKDLSYNNVIDMDTALECVKMFDEPTCVIVKHANPCGVASAKTISSAYNKAYQSDPISAFGSIIAFNKTIDIDTAMCIIQQKFVEAIIAPKIHPDCFNIFSQKKNMRILICGDWSAKKPEIDLKSINGGLLIQNCDNISIPSQPKSLKIVTIAQPTNQEMQDAIFCWKIVKFIKSNAIVCGKNKQTTGIGSGQMNRVCSVKIATTAFMNQNTLNISGSTMASDGFFSFPDGIHIAAKMGIQCIIQPGGSIKDNDIIETANQYGISMIFTNQRHFRH